MFISPTETFIIILMVLVPILVIGGLVFGFVRFSHRQQQLETRVRDLETGQSAPDQQNIQQKH